MEGICEIENEKIMERDFKVSFGIGSTVGDINSLKVTHLHYQVKTLSPFQPF